MIPADQRLEAADFTRRGIDERLVVQLEFVPLDRIAQIELELVACARLFRHHVFEQPPGIAAFGLGLIEREIGALDELFRLLAVLRREHDADAGFDDGPVAVEIVGLADEAEQPVRQCDRTRARIAVHRLQHREFVAAQPRDHVVPVNAGLEADRDLPQQPVAGKMPERIVDGFEAIEIEQQNVEALAMLAQPHDRPVDLRLEQPAAGQFGQRVVVGEVQHLTFGPGLLGDVLMRRHPAAGLHRPQRDRIELAVAAFDQLVDRPAGMEFPQ